MANETSPCRKLTSSKYEETRSGRPSLRWLDSAQNGLRIMGARGWMTKALDRNPWRRPRPIQGCSARKEEEDMSSKNIDRIWGQPILLHSGYQGLITWEESIRSE
jgi:hypothetical protein